MPSGFKSFGEEEFDRVFMKEIEIIDNFVGNRLWSWGSNTSGRLGDGTTTGKNSPGTTAGGGTNWKQVSVGSTLSSGVKTDGTLWTWGSNDLGQLGSGDTTSRSSPGTTSGGGTDWKQVSCGYKVSAAIKTDGALWTWGSNARGQLGTNNTTSRSSPGTTIGAGTNWKQVSTGRETMYAIKTDGTLWSWGADDYGALGKGGSNASRSSPGTTAGGGTNWKQVSSGRASMMAIKTDGTLWGCGYNRDGKLGTGDTASKQSPVTTIGGGTNWKVIGTSFRVSAAIKTDGTLWTWGNNSYGGLGNGTTTNRSSPGTTAGGGTNWKNVPQECSENTVTMAAIKNDGTLWTWGYGAEGQLGDGGNTSRSSPGTTVSNSQMWKQVSISLGCFGIAD
jgi:alpha-tubulin suppressor-like RCC1 family protein